MERQTVTDESGEPGAFAPSFEEHYPACLRPEIARLAAAFYQRRIAEGLEPDAVQDWLDAERYVTRTHRTSPARMLPGGDLFPLT